MLRKKKLPELLNQVAEAAALRTIAENVIADVTKIVTSDKLRVTRKPLLATCHASHNP